MLNVNKGISFRMNQRAYEIIRTVIDRNTYDLFIRVLAQLSHTGTAYNNNGLNIFLYNKSKHFQLRD